MRVAWRPALRIKVYAVITFDLPKPLEAARIAFPSIFINIKPAIA